MSFLKDFDHLRIQLKDVLSATNNFDPNKVIGRGGFGNVYKGEISSPEGQITAAFKQLIRRPGGQGQVEFWKEVMMLSKYKHKNLITLMHFCIDGDKMILVYEYASRGSLDRYLTNPLTLTWIRRLKISVEAARGLQFLHDPKDTKQILIHRDIKSGNILLDEEWTAKVSDFGLSNVGPANQQHSYLVTHVVGTHGYCDPSYAESGFLSKESDVYSFGVVLFELLSGRLCHEYHEGRLTKILVGEWRRCYEDDMLDEIILPDLRRQMNRASLKSFSAIAYQCLKKDRKDRPTMTEILLKLEFSLKQQVPENHEELKLKKIRNSHDDSVLRGPELPFLLKDDSYDRVLQEGDGPGRDEFRIEGDAKPGNTLTVKVFGFSEGGCKFQWLRVFQDDNWMYIERATEAEYVVTADDVGSLIAVECVLTNNGGQQGKVRLFANQQKKVTCDPEMQKEIDNYVSAGRASFRVFMRAQNWAPATLSLTRSGYQINATQQIHFMRQHYLGLSIVISPGFANGVLLRRHNGNADIFRLHDVRTRDVCVLTMRMFQSKASGHEDDSYDSEDDRGIDEFQIEGVAKPGNTLTAFGFSEGGCKFQWVRHFEDGTWKYIEEAAEAEYVVTADDVGSLIAVECVAMNNRGLQRKVRRLFANQQKKITCDPEMQQEIDHYMSAGEASFTAFLQGQTSMQVTISLSVFGYQIYTAQQLYLSSQYYSDLAIIIPPGVNTDFLLRQPNGFVHSIGFSYIRTRDVCVLTMRMFQRKCLEQLPGSSFNRF